MLKQTNVFNNHSFWLRVINVWLMWKNLYLEMKQSHAFHHRWRLRKVSVVKFRHKNCLVKFHTRCKPRSPGWRLCVTRHSTLASTLLILWPLGTYLLCVGWSSCSDCLILMRMDSLGVSLKPGLIQTLKGTSWTGWSTGGRGKTVVFDGLVMRSIYSASIVIFQW